MKHLVRNAAALMALLALGGPTALAQKTATKPPKAKITVAQAQKAALKKYPGKLVGKTPLENEEGKWQYAVSIQSGRTLREVMVDAKTGKIANVEVTTKEKEATEQAKTSKSAKGGKAKSAKTKDDEKGEKD